MALVVAKFVVFLRSFVAQLASANTIKLTAMM
jgi:hypothetical protein